MGHVGGAAGSEACMHARVARYTYTGDAQELALRAEEGMLPIFQSQPGFKACSFIESEGEIISFSAWESAEAAKVANALDADWVAENLADRVELKGTLIGKILFNTALGVSTLAGTRV
jgi:heme-degrading monooxygenase HmoA